MTSCMFLKMGNMGNVTLNSPNVYRLPVKYAEPSVLMSVKAKLFKVEGFFITFCFHYYIMQF